MSRSHIRRYLKHGTLPQLTVFEATARLGSFTRAAEELYMAQPTVSTLIKKLTETVGAPLFEQVGKRIHLTDAGRSLYTASTEIFDTLSRVERAMADLRGVHSGTLAVAAGTGACFIPSLLAVFTRKYPGIDISMRFHNRAELCRRFVDNEDDLYLFTTPPVQDVVTQALTPNPMVVCARHDHPLAQARAISFARVVEQRFLMREPGSGTRLIAERVFDRLGLWPRLRMELSTNDAIKRAIAEGLGVSIVSRDTLATDASEPELVALDVEGFPLPQQWYFVYASGKHLSRPARAFVELALAHDFNAPPRCTVTPARNSTPVHRNAA